MKTVRGWSPERVHTLGIFMDVYGDLLSLRQKQVLDLKTQDDLSFGEIAEVLNITRQAALDALSRGAKALYRYEGVIGQISKNRQDAKTVEDIKMTLQCMTHTNWESMRDKALKQLRLFGSGGERKDGV